MSAPNQSAIEALNDRLLVMTTLVSALVELIPEADQTRIAARSRQLEDRIRAEAVATAIEDDK